MKLICKIILPMICLLLTASAAFAVNCHCFTDREFKADAPEVADPYLLATARNSLFAASLGLAKADVVKMRMGGAEAYDLWVSHLGGKTTAKSADELMDAKIEHKSWAKAFEALKVDPAKLGEEFAASLARGDSDEIAAEKLADPYLVKGFGLSPEKVAALRATGATTAQATLAALLKTLTAINPMDNFEKVKSGEATWGMLFDKAGIAAGRVSKLIIAKVSDALAK